MQKLFSILLFVLLYVAIALAQATVDFDVLVHDNVGMNQTLSFGLDTAATDGIDPQLGESDLPPPPPGNAFDARFWLPPFAGALSSWKDYRNAPAFPFTGNKQHVIKFQSTDFPITISWNLPGTIASSSYIRDPFGGTLVNASFSGADSVLVTISAIPYVEVSVDYTDVVPVELTSFTAQVSDQTVILSWITATELNNRGFEIQRFTDAESNWEVVGYVAGFGTTTEPKTYSFIDVDITNGIYHYRLKQIDYDGTSSYSDEIKVVVDLTPNEYALFQNYPNPFNPNTSVKFQVPKSGNVTIKIYDMLGQEVRTLFAEEVLRGTYTVDWDGLSDAGVQMSSGTYIYRMTAGEFVQSKEMVLLK
jgi:hypothetical protein